MTRGDVGAYDELFSYACPKFITPSPPAFDSPAANNSQTVRGGAAASPVTGCSVEEGG